MSSFSVFSQQGRVGLNPQQISMYNLFPHPLLANPQANKVQFPQRSLLPVVGQKRVRSEADERRAKRRKFYVDLRSVSNTIKKAATGNLEETSFVSQDSTLNFTHIFYPQEIPSVCQRSRAPIQRAGERKPPQKKNSTGIERSEDCELDEFLSLYRPPSKIPNVSPPKKDVPGPALSSSSSSSAQNLLRSTFIV